MPGDKSISHRAILLSAVATGRSEIDGFLESADTHAMEVAFAAMGVRIETPVVNKRVVHGVGLHGLAQPTRPIDCGNAGTAMRLLVGLLSGQSFDSVLIGDESLSRRPMRRVIEPLTAMGAKITAAADDLPPLQVKGGQSLRGIHYTMPLASAQVKSAILLATLYAQGETRVHEPIPTRDYTERMLNSLGWPVLFSAGSAWLSGGYGLRGADIFIPGDFSSAAFFIVAASIVPDSELLLRDVGINPRRIALLTVLKAMGADITIENPRQCNGEPIADINVRYARLRGIEVPTECVADMIDEFPVFFVAAAAAVGVTVIRGAAELRVKESDRIAVMAKGLRALRVHVEEKPDGAIIYGSRVQGGIVDCAGDHRCAMSFAIAGSISENRVQITDCKNVATSFPGFIELAQMVGMDIFEI